MRSVRDESGYNQGWEGGLATRIRGERRCELLMSKMIPDPSLKMLEIGCGRGEMAGYLAAKTGMQVLGVDRSESFVHEARSKILGGNVRFEVLDFTRAEDFSGQQFTYIVGNGILHHLYYDLSASLAAIKRLLAENGRIIFLEPNLHNPYVYLIFRQPLFRKAARLEPDEMAFTRRFAMERLSEAGFHDIEIEYRDFLVPGVPDWLIQPLVSVGGVAERTPGLRHLAQSLFISARV